MMKKSIVVALLGIVLWVMPQGLIAQTCGTGELDPRISYFLKLIGYQDFTLEELRAMPIDNIKYAGPPPMPYPKEDVRRIKITEDSIPVLVFNPTNAREAPIIINYHGGGFISPLLEGLEHSLWQEARTYGAIVFAVDYRVAPEHKFPAAVDDSYNAFQWIAAHGGEFGGDTNRMVLMGNSAGANLVTVITHRARKEGLAGKIKLQVLNGLPVDLRPGHLETSVSYRENAWGYFQTKDATYFSIETYAPGAYDHPEVSPILTEDLAGLPPAVMITAEFDPFRDDGFLYAARLREAGVKVWDKCFPGQIHCLIGLPPDAEQLQEFAALVLTAMQECFAD